MPRAHPFIWHYLWLAPHILQAALALLIWRRRLHKVFPLFFAYLVFEAAEEFTLYALDILPSISGDTFWRVFYAGLVIEGILKLAIVGELFFHLLRPWPVIARVGSRLISGAGLGLVLLASLAAAFNVPDNNNWFIFGPHILLQTFYIVECGLLVFIFGFAAYFKLAWDHRMFGVGLGMAVLACEHLASWAMTANGALSGRRQLLDLLNMATYHLCVLVWFYYLLVPAQRPQAAVSLPEHNLETWNQELERLLQQ
jgi:hypothetical protein